MTVLATTDQEGAVPDLAPPEIEWLDVNKSFHSHGATVTALDSVSFSVQQRECLALLGPSGCGKTTLLSMAAGLVLPTHGVVKHAGRPITGVNNQVGYVTQKDTVLPWRTAEKNVALALEIRGVDRSRRKDQVAETLELVGLGPFARHYPSELSGGMLKRLLLARTLVYRPRVLLLDEPFAALDAQLRATMHAELLRISAAIGSTMVLVTHDINEAVLLADRVLEFGGSPSRVVLERTITLDRSGDPDELVYQPEFSALTRELLAALHPIRRSAPRRDDDRQDGGS